MLGGKFAQQRHAIRIRHPDVEQNQVKRILFNQLSCLTGILRGKHIVPLILQDLREQFPNADLVVHYQKFCHLLLLKAVRQLS